MENKGRDLPGFQKKSFSMWFAGGEIWFEHLDGIYQFQELVIEKLRADAAVFRRPSSPAQIAFVLFETTVTPDILNAIQELMTKTTKRFMKVAFVGVDRRSKRDLTTRLYGNGYALGFFDDLEKTKEWLVAEGE